MLLLKLFTLGHLGHLQPYAIRAVDNGKPRTCANCIFIYGDSSASLLELPERCQPMERIMWIIGRPRSRCLEPLCVQL